MMDGMEEVAADYRYQGQATLIPKSDGREYPCSVRIRVYREVAPFDDIDADLRYMHRWDADVVGDPTAYERPPLGEATLRLPDGSTGEAMYQAIQPRAGALLWYGALTGQGRSPIE